MINVEVVYGTAQSVELIQLNIKEGATALEAIQQSGMMHLYPEIEKNEKNIGIYSTLCSENTILKEGDRVEIYRPLTIDPKEIRRKRAVNQKSKQH